MDRSLETTYDNRALPVRRSRSRAKTHERAEARGSMDVPFLVLTLIILTIGVLMVLSASYARAYYTSGNPTGYFLKQVIFAVSGIGLMYLTSLFRMSTFQKYSMLLMIAAILLLMAVPFIGTRVNGAKRWIDLKVTTFQPSEIAKLAVILFFATMICSFGDKMKTFKYGVVPFAAILVLIAGLLYLEPHLSATIIILGVGAVMMFAGGTKLKWFVLLGLVAALAGYVVIGRLGYAADRISSWRDPFSDLRGDGWQIVQSLYAVGSGGFLGLGIGQGRQKYLYLPEEHNDFIFAVLCEELGFVGAVLVLILFALLIIRGFWLALHAKNRYSALAVTGLTSLLALQVFLNVAVVTNLLPCTGISLPFFSYGGTALWLQMIEMGIILSASREIPLKRSKKQLKDAEREYGDLSEGKEAV
jgi:cell division protein FtsW